MGSRQQGQILRQFIPFGEWLPDQGSYRNKGLVTCENVIPIFGTYLAAGQITDLSVEVGNPLTEAVRGLHAHPTGPGSFTAYMGTTTKLYEFLTTVAPWTSTDRSGAVYNCSGTGGDAGWQFTSWGKHVLATNYVNEVQKQTNGAGNFADMIGVSSPNKPRAKYITAFRNHVWLGNYYEGGAHYPNSVWWSGVDDETYFGTEDDSEAMASGFQHLLDDLGWVNGFATGLDYLLIFRDRGIVRVDGPPWTFTVISVNEGCRWPNSIVMLNDECYFLGNGGFRVIRNGQKVERIGDDKITRTLLDSNYSTVALGTNSLDTISGAVDVSSGIIFWAYKSNVYPSLTAPAVFRGCDRFFAYSVRENRWSTIDIPSDLADQDPAGAASTLNSGSAYLCSRPDPGSAWALGREVLMAHHIAPDNTKGFKIAKFDSTNSAYGEFTSTFRTGYVQLEEGAQVSIHRVRPILEVRSPSTASRPAMTVTVESRSRPFRVADSVVQQPTQGAEATSLFPPIVAYNQIYNTDDNGWCPVGPTAHHDFHRITLAVTTDVQDTQFVGGTILYGLVGSDQVIEFEGFEVEYEVGGAG